MKTDKLKKSVKVRKKILCLSIRSRHPSCDALRRKIRLNVQAVYRHGSTSESTHKREINSIESVKTASSKLLMKQAFDEGGVKHLPWMKLSEAVATEKGITNEKVTLKYPVVLKHIFGSRGRGNYKIDNLQQFQETIKNKQKSSYILEQFFNGSREYRVHITKNGPVYSLRKMLKDEVPKEKRWVRNDSTCSWIMEHQAIAGKNGEFLGFQKEDSTQFDKPVNWDKIIEHCKKALQATKLDIGAVDLKVQSAKDKDGKPRKEPDFVLIEINSAPSLGKITSEIYIKELPKILEEKYGYNRTT